MKEEKTMAFGRRYRVGNYTVIKYNKVLRKEEVAHLRDMEGIKPEDRKNLERSKLPYIKVGTVSGIWGVEFCCTTAMFHLIDAYIADADDAVLPMLAGLFDMWFTDVCVPGDEEYIRAKAEVFKAYADRLREGLPPDDEQALKHLEKDENAKAVIMEMNGRKEGGPENG